MNAPLSFPCSDNNSRCSGPSTDPCSSTTSSSMTSSTSCSMSRLDDYVVLSTCGEGSFGKVYKCSQKSQKMRHVALKLIPKKKVKSSLSSLACAGSSSPSKCPKNAKMKKNHIETDKKEKTGDVNVVKDEGTWRSSPVSTSQIQASRSHPAVSTLSFY